MTSCFGGNRPFPSLAFVAEEKVDFVCYLGDLVYADGSETDDDYWWHWKRTLSQSGMRALNASASMVATWDDHEFTNNYNPAETPQAELIYQMGLRNFRRAIPQRIGDTDNIWRSLNYGDVLDLFVLDCRTERSADQYVSPQQ